ncbi:MAG: Na+/H+ antiporter NhaA, partial [Bacteroidetes bacterium]|nr:Na+/H+ antiporter NhaA [Bacteroidota bacterium]
MFAAIGGMVLPALIYVFFNYGEPAAAGWGIPTATDIAFSLGVLALLGTRVPLPLKIFLTALAIIDDIGAVLIIAIFYSSGISLISLAIAAAFLAVMAAINYLGVRRTFIYAILGIGGVWTAFFLSGVHPTIAGILAAFTF